MSENNVPLSRIQHTVAKGEQSLEHIFVRSIINSVCYLKPFENIYITIICCVLCLVLPLILYLVLIMVNE